MPTVRVCCAVVSHISPRNEEVLIPIRLVHLAQRIDGRIRIPRALNALDARQSRCAVVGNAVLIREGLRIIGFIGPEDGVGVLEPDACIRRPARRVAVIFVPHVGESVASCNEAFVSPCLELICADDLMHHPHSVELMVVECVEDKDFALIKTMTRAVKRLCGIVPRDCL